MRKKSYISEDERAKCRIVMDAFKELYEEEESDVVVIDVEKYGFVKLDFYIEQRGFDNILTFTDSKALFDELWNTWLFNALCPYMHELGMENKCYTEIFELLPYDKQREFMKKKAYFAKKAGIAV